MPSPPSPTGWQYRPRHAPSFALGLAVSFLGLLLVAEAASRFLAPSGILDGLIPPAGRLVSRPQIEDRLRASRTSSVPRVLFLTDSVGTASALLENDYPAASRSSLTSRLKSILGRDGTLVVPLTADGLLMPDLAALLNTASRVKFESVLLLLNTRMFAPEFEEGEKAFSRAFLIPALPSRLREAADREWPGSQTPAIRFESFLQRHWVTFRATQTLKTLWYDPTPNDAWTRLARRLAGMPPGPRKRDDLEEAALKLKVVPYYPTGPWKGPPMEGLQALLDVTREKDIPIRVVFTPQNTQFLGDEYDPAWLKRNIASLKDLCRRTGGRVSFEDWSGRYPETLFLDHCHLTPEGNERLAGDLSAFVTGRKP